ncbi:hypothetical protein Clacol_008364 [Clathrus columnatus]|uniref:Spindle assembly checkpoint component MAD1 n=1 Tax=Clathrus columnatus TaxID=1419009 RepID=A0AAV5AK20_9AGAM|nr:hypothetical protein Clacol_008364 [Clathrus columnatus]
MNANHDANDDFNDDPFLSVTTSHSRRKTAQKRTASYAQLEEDGGLNSVDVSSHESSSRIHIKSLAFASQMERSSFERKILALESERKGLEVKLGMKDREIARLENDKRWLAERETEERSEKETLRKDAENERKQAAAALSALRSQLAIQTEEHAQLQQDFSSLKRTTSQTINEQKIHLLDVTRQAAEFEEEIKQLKEALEERDEMVYILRSELDGKDTSSTLEAPPDINTNSDTQGWKVIQEELHRQASYIQKTSTENLKLKAEVASLKERHESIQVLREEKRQMEGRLRNMDDLRRQVVELGSENDRLRGQLSSLSDVANSDAMEDLLKDLQSFRLRNAQLEDSLGTTRAEVIILNSQLTESRVELATTQEQCKILESDLEEVKAESQRLRRRVEILEGEIKFWKTTAELGSSKGQDHSKSENSNDDIPQQAKNLVENLRQENEALLNEISRLGGGVERHGVSWTDLSKSLNEEMRRRVQIEEELSAAQTEISTLLGQIENLEQTLFELRGDIASGSHVPPNHRVLCLKENPLQLWVDTREEVVKRLKQENEGLLNLLADLRGQRSVNGENDSSMEMTNVPFSANIVPRESWEVEHAEKLALEEAIRQKDKRLTRLQEIFRSKAQEFRDAISSILGFKLHFSSNGQVRLTSQYDVGTSFVFQPSPSSSTTPQQQQDGQVNMQLVGAGESSLDDLPRTVDFWIEKRGSIPALMATVTLECFDKVWRNRRDNNAVEGFI